MKPIFLLTLTGSLLIACTDNNQNSGSTEKSTVASSQQAGSVDSANLTTIQWLDSMHQDLPKVKEGQVVEALWTFKNSGDKPLVIVNASASCGCTVAEKPEQPIAPGEQAAIKAKFDSHGREGEQRKQVFVSANTKGNTNHELSFSLEVEKK